ncbi:MAG: hypothetical protein ABW061_02480 [Polyangiaceae bacterium]
MTARPAEVGRAPLETSCDALPKTATDSARRAPPDNSKWHRGYLDGDILLKWTHYSQEGLGPLLLFAQNSKVTGTDRVWQLLLHCFVTRTRAVSRSRRDQALESSAHGSEL